MLYLNVSGASHTKMKQCACSHTRSVWQRAQNRLWLVSNSSQSSCQQVVGRITSGRPNSTLPQTPSARRTLQHTRTHTHTNRQYYVTIKSRGLRQRENHMYLLSADLCHYADMYQGSRE